MSMNAFHARQGKPRPAAHARTAAERHGLQRVDQLLVSQGLAPSRTAARALVEAGRVSHDGQPVTKPALALPPDARLAVTPAASDRFVSRGALKLEGALARSGLDVQGAVCLDIGQSTGGFTDCLLQAGAAKVVGVEVGHDQLHPRLCKEPRCVTLEGLNARRLTAADLGEHFPPRGFDLLVCDASFISLTLLLTQWPALLSPAGHMLALVKPQFEVGPQGLGKGGLVRDAALYAEVEAKLRAAAHAAGLIILDWFDSPISGGDGNREFFFHAIRTPAGDTDPDTP
ncbi:TlyA family RNA methyltransferase [Thauera aromatica]|uniref:RNA binding methyltransferase FtsJ like n=1 Tax=Thauera aromatica K172 TaxID=44139 RepID=A0A2R4BJA7_THAAR|nr:TlyA family RNA methyltransferase [Thauera aromatica]AVR87389.1 RNA binding methyltransferase FtsJ like [Thauera aromatica K172]MCK2096511.1 TlyA family RNA methyltransferase [Thauera aromatica]